jgi:hypothetical protein
MNELTVRIALDCLSDLLEKRVDARPFATAHSFFAARHLVRVLHLSFFWGLLFCRVTNWKLHVRLQ